MICNFNDECVTIITESGLILEIEKDKAMELAQEIIDYYVDDEYDE